MQEKGPPGEGPIGKKKRIYRREKEIVTVNGIARDGRNETWTAFSPHAKERELISHSRAGSKGDSDGPPVLKKGPAVQEDGEGGT